ncbi:MAG: vWA domain-containing protein [Nanoarchaeota archaeon]
MKKTILIILILILNVLLVNAQSEEQNKSDINIVIVVDISQGTENHIAVEKDLVLSVVDSLSEKDNVGVVVFGYAFGLSCSAFDITQGIHPLKDIKKELKDKISKLKFDGESCFDVGMQGGYQLLSKVGGSKNIIFISDGKTTYQKLRDDTLDVVRNTDAKGIKIFTVGVGTETDDILLNNMAVLGKGVYYKTDAPNGLKVLFGDNSTDNGDGSIPNKKDVPEVRGGNYHVPTQSEVNNQIKTNPQNQIVKEPNTIKKFISWFLSYTKTSNEITKSSSLKTENQSKSTLKENLDFELLAYVVEVNNTQREWCKSWNPPENDHHYIYKDKLTGKIIENKIWLGSVPTKSCISANGIPSTIPNLKEYKVYKVHDKNSCLFSCVYQVCNKIENPQQFDFNFYSVEFDNALNSCRCNCTTLQTSKDVIIIDDGSN